MSETVSTSVICTFPVPPHFSHSRFPWPSHCEQVVMFSTPGGYTPILLRAVRRRSLRTRPKAKRRHDALSNHERVSEHEERDYRRDLCRLGRMLDARKSCSFGRKRSRRATPANVSTVRTRATGDAVRRGVASWRISRERSAVRIRLPSVRQSRMGRRASRSAR